MEGQLDVSSSEKKRHKGENSYRKFKWNRITTQELFKEHEQTVVWPYGNNAHERVSRNTTTAKK